jgi:hypothetical protein
MWTKSEARRQESAARPGGRTIVRTPRMRRNWQPRGAQQLVGLASCVRAITSTFVQQITMLHVDDVMHFDSDTQGTRVAADDCDGLIRSRIKEAVLGGRVEMWRGGSRFGLSVAAPFVWRCPSNLAVGAKW